MKLSQRMKNTDVSLVPFILVKQLFQTTAILEQTTGIVWRG